MSTSVKSIYITAATCWTYVTHIVQRLIEMCTLTIDVKDKSLRHRFFRSVHRCWGNCKKAWVWQDVKSHNHTTGWALITCTMCKSFISVHAVPSCAWGGDPGFDSRFSQPSPTSGFSAGCSWPGVSILWLADAASLICSVCLSVAARSEQRLETQIFFLFFD